MLFSNLMSSHSKVLSIKLCKKYTVHFFPLLSTVLYRICKQNGLNCKVDLPSNRLPNVSKSGFWNEQLSMKVKRKSSGRVTSFTISTRHLNNNLSLATMKPSRKQSSSLARLRVDIWFFISLITVSVTIVFTPVWHGLPPLPLKWQASESVSVREAPIWVAFLLIWLGQSKMPIVFNILLSLLVAKKAAQVLDDTTGQVEQVM